MLDRYIGIATLAVFLTFASKPALAAGVPSPDNPQAQLGLSKIPAANEALKKGDAFDEKGKPKEAMVQYREAIRLDPDCAKAHSRLGGCLAKYDHEYDTAILEEQTSIKLEPKYYLPHVILGEVYANLGKNEDSIE